MIQLRKSSERGRTKISWLDSYHSFSFGDYYDSKNIHFGPLRVMNDDTIEPRGGFPTHPHKDMEIVTIVLEGTVAHKDSSGGEGTITPNEIQRMTAGRGILHSEFNPSDSEVLKLLQIWFMPNRNGLTPSYEQKKYSHEAKKNKLLKVVSGENEDGTIFINQDAQIYLSDLDKGKILEHTLRKNRGAYLHTISGEINIDGTKLNHGDAVKITDTDSVKISSLEDSRIILFDLPMNF